MKTLIKTIKNIKRKIIQSSVPIMRQNCSLDFIYINFP